VRLDAPFRPAGEHIAADLPGAHVLFTTRRGGVSKGPYTSLNLGLFTDDERDNVMRNRERVAVAVGIGLRRFAQGRQVHGAVVRTLSAPPDPDDAPAPADGQATSVPGVAPFVTAADCLPIALAVPGAVAMLHAGWRGLAGGVVGAGIAALRSLGADGRVTAAIGPGAGGCCYQVGEEVHAAFAHHGDAVRDGGNLDLKAIARRELEAAGAAEVHDVGLCTLCAEPGLFFSHRRDGGVTGRQIGVAWRD
jgi:purine-nucleoside/S-methyl-5'-thioadenosine phosphorylase / adenosine deaminase